MDKFTRLFYELYRMKSILRTGWMFRGIKNGESLSDHCFGTTLLALFLLEEEKNLDALKVLKMAILHEAGEVRIGDVTHPSKKYLTNKDVAELEAVKDIFKEFNNEYTELIKEFIECNTKEALLVKAADKLDMMLTAYLYELNGAKSLSDFWENLETDKAINAFNLTRRVYEDIKSLRKQLK